MPEDVCPTHEAGTISSLSKRLCFICGHSTVESNVSDSASVRSNVRRFRHETYTVWRCPKCQSLHCHDEVDLEYYYSHYPFLVQELDWVMRIAYSILLRRLKRAGLKKTDRILDYGCGGGCFVEFLKSKGYDATGFDPYSETYGQLDMSRGLFDCVVSLDVVEHDEDPLGILKKIDEVTASGGMLAIGTPNASGIRLDDMERYIHELHQPYHRHIFSMDALRDATSRNGLQWDCVESYSTPHLNMPVISVPLIHHYSASRDATLDVFFERKPGLLKFWLNPWTYFLMAFGYFMCEDTDMLLVFTKKS